MGSPAASREAGFWQQRHVLPAALASNQMGRWEGNGVWPAMSGGVEDSVPFMLCSQANPALLPLHHYLHGRLEGHISPWMIYAHTDHEVYLIR